MTWGLPARNKARAYLCKEDRGLSPASESAGNTGTVPSERVPERDGTVPVLQDMELYMLFQKGIAQVDLETHAITLLAESPVPIGPGGDYLDGRIYFGSGSHMYSYAVSTSAN